MNNRPTMASSNGEKKIDLQNLPAVHEDKGARTLGVFMMLFSSVWGGFPTLMLIRMFSSGSFKPEMLFMLVFTVIGTVLFFAGLNMVFRKKVTRIDSNGVSVHQTGLFSQRSWSAPFSHYRGILAREEYHSGGKNSPSYTLYLVELLHEEKDKTVQLYSSRSGDGHRSIWEDYCRTLGLPALEKDGAGYSARDVEDLDKSAAQLVREGKVAVEFDPTAAVPEGIDVIPADGELVLTLKLRKMPIGAVIIGMLLPSAFIYVGFFRKDAPWMFGVAGIIILTVITAVMILLPMTRQRVNLSKESVRTCWILPWGEMNAQEMKACDIESVKIFNREGTAYDAVWLSGDSGSVSVGSGLKSDALNWIKNCILKVLGG